MLRSYTTKSNKLKKIYIQIVDNTFVYNANKKIVFNFDTLKNTLSNYQFSGSKGFVILSKDSFYIESIILNGD